MVIECSECGEKLRVYDAIVYSKFEVLIRVEPCTCKYTKTLEQLDKAQDQIDNMKNKLHVIQDKFNSLGEELEELL